MIQKSVGLYINKNILQLVVLKQVFNSTRLIVADSVELPKDTSIASIIMANRPLDKGKAKAAAQQSIDSKASSAALEAAVIELLKKNKVKKNDIITTALPLEFVVIRYFEMARLISQEARSAIPFEARKYLPYKLEDIIYDYRITYEKVPREKMAVMFVAAEKTSVSGYMAFLNSLGLKIDCIEPVPYSLIRFFYYAKDIKPGQLIAWLRIGQDSADINIVRNKTIFLTRNVSFVMPKAVASQDVYRAGQSAKEKSDSGKDAVGDYRFDTVLAEIGLSFDYFHRQFPDDKIEKLVIWADADDQRIQLWQLKIGEVLNVPVVITNPFETIEGAKKCSVEYAMACGLALRNVYETHRKDINLNAGFKKLEFERLLRLGIFEACLVLTLLLVFYLAGAGKTNKLKEEFSAVSATRPVVTLPAQDFSIANLEKTRSDIQRKIEYAGKLINNRIVIGPKINRVAELLPDGFWIDKMVYSSSSPKKKPDFVVTGYVYDPNKQELLTAVNHFVESLKKDRLFSTGFAAIKLESVSNKKYADLPVVNFQITCTAE